MPAVSQKCWRKVFLYKCRHCWLLFPRFGQLLSHANRHSSRGSHECVECRKVFHSFLIYQLHGRVFHGKKRPIIGEVCDPRFFFHSALETCLKWQKWRGRNSAERQNVVVKAQKLYVKETRKQIAAPESPECNVPIASKHRSADGIAAYNAAKNVNLLNNGNIGLKKTSTYSCPCCSETFLSFRQLKQHMRTHDDLRPYKCVQCKKEYKRNAHLVQHVRTVHKGERPHRCLQCSKTFARPSHLVAHNVTHTRERNFQCDVCELRFAHHFQLTAHQQV